MAEESEINRQIRNHVIFTIPMQKKL